MRLNAQRRWTQTGPDPITAADAAAVIGLMELGDGGEALALIQAMDAEWRQWWAANAPKPKDRRRGGRKDADAKVRD